ncbi:MAG: GAF domain-containing protein [Actinobacteria bacterium]|nr:GAF domain-containing protein [Actinomycetota bacterium]
MLRVHAPAQSSTAPDNRPGGRSDLRDIVRITKPDGRGLLERVLVASRDTLGMQLAYLSEWEDAELVYRRVERSAPGFIDDVQVGARERLGETYCKRAADGVMPPLVADARNDPRTREFMSDYDPGIGAICTVPVVLSDGRLWGTFCVIGRECDPRLGERDLALCKSWLSSWPPISSGASWRPVPSTPRSRRVACSPWSLRSMPVTTTRRSTPRRSSISRGTWPVTSGSTRRRPAR